MSYEVEISAIVPVVRLFDSSGKLARRYVEMLERTGRSFELVYVLDGEHAGFLEQITRLAESDVRIRLVQLAKSFGEASALTAGFASTTGKVILTLPAYAQVEI